MPSAPELGARLGNPGRGPGPLRWCGADDQIGAQGHNLSGAESHHDGAGDESGKSGIRPNLRQHRQPEGGDGEATGNQESRADGPGDHRSEHRPHDEAGRRRQRPKPSFEGAHPKHQLQVLGDEEVDSEDGEERERVRRE